MPAFTLAWGGHRLVLGERTRIMGIVNVTPDSFSDGGRFFDPGAAAAQGLRLAAEGADILDVGGESTRPFSDPVSAEEEIRRVVPVIRALTAKVRAPISVDTTKAAVAEAALDAGAAMINDVSAGRTDPDLLPLAGRRGVPVILMHMKGTPKTMQKNPEYADLIGEIRDFLADARERAAAAGVDPGLVILDPGIGFGKTFAHNLSLLNRLDAFAALNAPLLVGASRKAFIRHLLREADGPEPAPDGPPVETGSQAAVSAAVLGGAHIVRVHDVARTRDTLRVLDAVRAA
jgi:dihydropteroate synthase